MNAIENPVFPLAHCLLTQSPDQMSFMLQNINGRELKGLFKFITPYLFPSVTDIRLTREETVRLKGDIFREAGEDGIARLLSFFAVRGIKEGRLLLAADTEVITCKALKAILPSLLSKHISGKSVAPPGQVESLLQ